MSVVKIVTGKGKAKEVDASAVEKFKASHRGEVLQPGDSGYEDSRTIWNAMIDKKPALIACCTGVTDVKHAVKFASEHNLLTAIHGGGHNIAGNAVCEGGLMINLSKMKSVRIDPQNLLAHVEPGVILGDFDHEALSFGLATPLGINSTTGVAGLTLGGGFGWLSRKYGMTVDNVTAVDIVTADGNFITADEKNHPDLFWAVRGGGGNFGVVTRFEFKLHPVGPDLLSGLIVFSLDEGVSVLKKYREFALGLSDETSVWAVLRKAPPLPFLPEEVHGKEIVAFAVCHAGDPKAGEKALEPIRSFGKVLGEHVGVQPFTAWQAAFDPLLTPGARNYWKSHNFSKLADEAIETAVKYAGKLPSSQCEIFFAHLGGAIGRIAPDANAYSHRDAEFVLNVHGRWESPGDDEKCVSWSRDFFDESAPYATGGVYINFMTEEETDRVHSAYGSAFEKLLKIKAKYDPDNLFRLNQNIS